jgi:hypothetical protein
VYRRISFLSANKAGSHCNLLTVASKSGKINPPRAFPPSFRQLSPPLSQNLSLRCAGTKRKKRSLVVIPASWLSSPKGICFLLVIPCFSPYPRRGCRRSFLKPRFQGRTLAGLPVGEVHSWPQVVRLWLCGARDHPTSSKAATSVVGQCSGMKNVDNGLQIERQSGPLASLE